MVKLSILTAVVAPLRRVRAAIVPATIAWRRSGEGVPDRAAAAANEGASSR